MLGSKTGPSPQTPGPSPKCPQYNKKLPHLVAGIREELLNNHLLAGISTLFHPAHLGTFRHKLSMQDAKIFIILRFLNT
jgi:hypothetical protein